MRLRIDFTTSTLDVADVTELRWWAKPRRYRAALYSERLEPTWIRDDTNAQVAHEIALDLFAARYTGQDISRLRL